MFGALLRWFWWSSGGERVSRVEFTLPIVRRREFDGTIATRREFGVAIVTRHEFGGE